MSIKYLAAAAAMLFAAPAGAQICQFDLAGTVTQPGQYFGAPLVAQFQAACSPTPDVVDVPNQLFILSNVPGVFNGPGIGGNNGQGTPPLLFSDIGFYPLSNGGGFSANYPDDGSVNGGFGLFSLLGDQLYSGTLDNPTFIPGTYTFTSDFYYDDVAATLNITQLPGAVPEPATWAMMIVGFGLIGGAIRRHRVTVAFA